MSVHVCTCNPGDTCCPCRARTTRLNTSGAKGEGHWNAWQEGVNQRKPRGGATGVTDLLSGSSRCCFENDYNGACLKKKHKKSKEVLRTKVYFDNYKTVIIILYNTVISESTFKTCMCIRFWLFGKLKTAPSNQSALLLLLFVSLS